MHLKVKNPLELNDWDFSSMVMVLISWTLISLTLIGLDILGLSVPFARQIVVGAYVIAAPGYLILRVLRMHELGTVKTVLLAVGLGLAALMGLGLGLNQAFLLLDWKGAFSLNGILTGVLVLNGLLLALAWKRDRNFRSQAIIDLAPYVSTPAMVLYSIPLIAIVSTYILNRSGENLMQIVLLLLIGAGMVAACWKRLVPKELYPLAIFSFALALLWHASLVSYQMVEWADVSFEFWSANQSVIQGMWEPSLTDRTDTVLSLTVMVPMIVVPADIGLIPFFKMVFPLLFTLVPLGVYHLAERRMDPRLAMLSVFIMISISSFYTDMLGLNRQMMAEMFMVLIIVVLLDVRLPFSIKMVLLIAFGLSLAVSHYGLLMIFVVCLFFSMVLLVLSSIIFRQRHLNLKVLAALCIGLMIFTLLWYTVVAESNMAKIMFSAIDQIIQGLWGFQGTESSQILSIFNFGELTLQNQLNVTVFYLALALIIIAIVHQLITRKDEPRFEPEYLALAFAFMLAMVSGAYSPNIFNFISESRLLHLTTIILLPLAVLGGHVIIRGISMRGLKRSENTARKASVALFAVVVVAILITSSGLVSLANGKQVSFELTPDDIPRPNFNNMEGNAAKWAAQKVGDAQRIRADAHQAYLVKMYTGDYWPLYTHDGQKVYNILPHQTLYFLGTENVNGMIWLEDPANFRLNNSYIPINPEFTSHLFNQNMIYNTQYTLIYYDNFI